jgi:hypothetical protein
MYVMLIELLVYVLLILIQMIMNKKFSTLVAGLFLAGTLPVGAIHTENGEVPYRTDLVKSAVSSYHCNGVNSIDETKWYQLVVSEEGDKEGEQANHVDGIGANMTVLTMERDYTTGNLTLTVKKIEEAALTHSLWKITTVRDNVNSRDLFAYENMETGYKLTFDEFNALDLNGSSDATTVVKEVEATILNGCTDNWRWYTHKAQTSDFAQKTVFSFFHGKDSVMAMALNQNNEVVLVKESAVKAEDEAKSIKGLLAVRPIIAGAKVLNAAEINSMIDADGSYKNFIDIANNNTSENVTLGGTKVNFKFSKTLDKNPLTETYKAVASPYRLLDRDKWNENTNEVYSGYDILLQNVKTGKYLMVSPDRFEKPTAPGVYGGLLLKDADYQKLNSKTNPTALVNADPTILPDVIGNLDAHQARYHFKFTYYPTNDSLVIEPLNASVKESEEIDYLQSDLVRKDGDAVKMVDYFNTVNAGIAYNNGSWGNVLFNKAAGVPVALGAINNGTSTSDASEILTVSVPSNIAAAQDRYKTLCKEEFACSRSSIDGNPAYVTNYCVNHVGDKGTVEYLANMGVKISFDNFRTPLVRTTVKSGLYFIQLSTTVQDDPTYTEKRHNGSYIVADMAGHLVYDVKDANQDFTHMPATQWVVEELNCDVYDNDVNTNEAALVKITNREYGIEGFVGQLYSAGKDANGQDKYYFINHKYAEGMWKEGTDIHNWGETFACHDTLTFTAVDPKTTFGYEVISDDVLKENVYALQQLVNGEAAWYLGISADSKNLGLLKEDPTMFELHLIGEATDYGYTPAQKTTQPGLAGIDTLKRAVYAVKVKDTNKIDNDHTYVALDHMHRYVVADEKDIQAGKDGLTWALFYLKNNNHVGEDHYYSLVNAVGVETGSLKNVNTIAGKLVVEASTFLTKVDNLCSTSSDVFKLAGDPRPLYANLEGDDVIGAAYSNLVNNKEKGLKLGVDRTGGYLYEDETPGLNYLSHENLNTGADKSYSFYVDKVAKSNARMPQYLFVTAADSVPAYTYCITEKHGINPGCDHAVSYPGYVSGRFLVNLNDSVRTSIDKVSATDKFMSDGYVRLAFVEAVHRGDSLYVLKAPYTLASISVKDVDGTSYVLPPYLSKDSLGVVYDIVDLNGEHNNAAFSLRYVGDTENDGFLLESFDYGMKNEEDGTIEHLSGIGSFEGAWVKLQNGVPVLAQISDDTDKGDHNTGDNLAGSEYYDKMSWSEVLNQAAIFGLTEGVNGGDATANEDVEVSSVTVIAGNGQITVAGAAGKKVVITNILGQTVANTVVTSDNATIAAPAGVVVVAIEGEDAVKAIVK